MREASRWLIALIAAALVACGGSQLPSYGAPQGQLLNEADFQSGDLIPYRTLTRADFLGSAPTGPASEHADQVGAQTYALIKHDPGVSFAGRETKDRRVTGKIQNLYFRAWMDRSRSWWNPKPSQLPEGYVLQHEQIHFAVVEVEAGRMNLDGARLMQRTFEGKSSQEVQKAVKDAIDEIVEDGMARLLDRSLDFDEDTSAQYDPKKQNEWWERVQRELASKR